MANEGYHAAHPQNPNRELMLHASNLADLQSAAQMKKTHQKQEKHHG